MFNPGGIEPSHWRGARCCHETPFEGAQRQPCVVGHVLHGQRPIKLCKCPVLGCPDAARSGRRRARPANELGLSSVAKGCGNDGTRDLIGDGGTLVAAQEVEAEIDAAHDAG